MNGLLVMTLVLGFISSGLLGFILFSLFRHSQVLLKYPVQLFAIALIFLLIFILLEVLISLLNSSEMLINEGACFILGLVKLWVFAMYCCYMMSLNIEFVYKINRSIDRNYSKRFKIYSICSTIISGTSITLAIRQGCDLSSNSNGCGLFLSSLMSPCILTFAIVIGMMSLYCIWVYFKKLSKTQRKVWKVIIKILFYIPSGLFIQGILGYVLEETGLNYVTVVLDLTPGIIIFICWITEPCNIHLLWNITRVNKQIKKIDVRAQINETSLSEMASKILLGEFSPNLNLSEVQYFGDLFENLTKKV